MEQISNKPNHRSRRWTKKNRSSAALDSLHPNQNLCLCKPLYVLFDLNRIKQILKFIFSSDPVCFSVRYYIGLLCIGPFIAGLKYKYAIKNGDIGMYLFLTVPVCGIIGLICGYSRYTFPFMCCWSMGRKF
ncbi:MAG: hypothetical protein Satyrvirus17_12 [Satyrvirus sp.]|uniref:Uncharacterized protein n=1 Tax=Satyrvirus sp. TaxID=2487771 RepID=A0A3G5AE36_9VIRU|nr:MAG: hypothetical protein Satyrvirus17_12 [Satyrvirus sp.]